MFDHINLRFNKYNLIFNQLYNYYFFCFVYFFTIFSTICMVTKLLLKNCFRYYGRRKNEESSSSELELSDSDEKSSEKNSAVPDK